MKIVAFLVIVSCSFLTSCNTKNIREPEYRDVRNIKLMELGPLQSTAGVDLVYYNPNNFGVQLTNASGDIYIDSSFFGHFELKEKVQVRKRSEFTLPAVVKIDMISAIKNQREIFQKAEALLRLQGMAQVRKAGFSREIPINYQQIQNIEKFRSLLQLK